MNMPKLDKIIFLDIDGVLNSEKAYLRGDCKYVEWEWEDGRKDHHQSFCPVSKLYINHLIKRKKMAIILYQFRDYTLNALHLLQKNTIESLPRRSP